MFTEVNLSVLTCPAICDEKEALLAGRASLLLAEATWGEKAADASVEYLEYRLVLNTYISDQLL